MLIYSFVNFHSDTRTDGWINRIYRECTGDCRFFIRKVNIGTVDVPDKDLILLPEELETKYRKNAIDALSVEAELVHEEKSDYVKFYEEQLLNIGREYNITGVLTLSINKSLQRACKELNVGFMCFELSALRTSNYFEFDMGPLMYNPPFYSEAEDKARYEEYRKIKDKIILKKTLSPLEMIMFGVKRQYLPMVYETMLSKGSYDVGVALSNNDPDNVGKWNNKRVLNEVRKVYRGKSILLREHPDYKLGITEDEDIDNSVSSICFIGKCRRIVSVASNISYEAMMFGRHVIDLSDHIYTHFVADENDFERQNTYTNDFLNFMFFGIFVPLELIFDEEYIRWRIQDQPTEAQIFNKNYIYICNQYLHIDKDVLNFADDIVKVILEVRNIRVDYEQGLRISNLKKILSEDWTKGDIIICGCGKDALACRELIELMGGNILCHMVSEKNYDLEEFVGKPVVYCKDMRLNKDTKFVISQRNRYVQYEVLKSVRELGDYTVIIF